MPRKVFVAGEILTAADVNTNLMDQAVMVFDDAAARTTAIPTPSEGMVTYLKDTDALEKFTTEFVPVGIAPAILQVVSTTITETFSASLLTTAFSSAVTGLSATITPSSTSSKILVSLNIIGARVDGNFPHLTGQIRRNTTPIGLATNTSSRQAVTFMASGGTIGDANASMSVVFEDVPSSTSALTYDVVLYNPSTSTITYVVNRSSSDDNNANRTRGISTITLMEVAG